MAKSIAHRTAGIACETKIRARIADLVVLFITAPKARLRQPSFFIHNSTLAAAMFFFYFVRPLPVPCCAVLHSRSRSRTKSLDELFNMRGFLDGIDRGSRPFLQRLASTQMFWVMVQQWLGRSAHSDDSRFLFFEECAVAVKNRRAGAAVPWRDRGTLGDDGAGGLGGGGGGGGW